MNNTTNNTTTDSTMPSTSEAERIFKVVFYVLLFLVGTIGNFLVVVVIKAKQKQRTVNDFFILNLAISDLTFLCFALPFYYYELFVSFTKFQFYCKFVWPMMSVSLFVSIFTLTLMAVERCWAILFPFKPRIKKPTLIIGIISVWILSIVCIAPLMIVSNAEGIYCIERWPKVALRKAYTAMLFILQFAIPVIVIAIAYIAIAITLVTTKVPNRTSINHRGQIVKQKSRADNIHIIRTVAIIVILFVICMLPNQMAWILTDFGGKQYQNLSEKFWLLAEALMFFHSCVNPIIYGSLTRQFREGYIKYLNFVCCCGRDNKRTIDLTENQQHVTRTPRTHHGGLAYRGSLKPPSSVNGVRSSFQQPTRITSCRTNTPPGTSRSSPSSPRSTPNSSRPLPSFVRSSPNSVRQLPSSTRPYSSTARPPSPLIIDNKMMTIIDTKISSVAKGDKKTEINANEIFSTNPIVHCKNSDLKGLLSDNKGNYLSDPRQRRATEGEITSSEINLGVIRPNFDVTCELNSTVLENTHALDTDDDASQSLERDNPQDERITLSEQLRHNGSISTYLQSISQSQPGSTIDKKDQVICSSGVVDGCCSPLSIGDNDEDDDEPTIQDTYL